MSENTTGAAGDERLAAVGERIDDAKQAAADLHDRDVLGDTGDDGGALAATGEADDGGHGAFEPSGDDRQAGENPSEGEAVGTPGEAGDAERIDEPGPNPL